MSNLNLGSFGDKRSSPKLNADALNHLPKHRRDWLEIFDDVKGKPAKVMPGTCEACVWNEGEHAVGCERWRDRASASPLRYTGGVVTRFMPNSRPCGGTP